MTRPPGGRRTAPEVRDHFPATCRRMLGRHGVDFHEIEVRKFVEAATPHFGSDRAMIVRLYRHLWDEMGDVLGRLPRYLEQIDSRRRLHSTLDYVPPEESETLTRSPAA